MWNRSPLATTTIKVVGLWVNFFLVLLWIFYPDISKVRLNGVTT
jgi:hypothetical protein